jgi:hypothetical protein
LKKGGVGEKRGGGNEIHAPCACGYNYWRWIPLHNEMSIFFQTLQYYKFTKKTKYS